MDMIDETFTTTEERFGELVTIEFHPGRGRCPCDGGKQERICRCGCGVPDVKEQFDLFMSGFNELIPCVACRRSTCMFFPSNCVLNIIVEIAG